MDLLCDDMIREILNYCSYRTTASLLSINKYFHQQSTKVEKMKTRRQLAHQLTKTQVKMRQYYKSNILDLQIGDRVTDTIFNYRVYDINRREGLLEIVDMVGHPINDQYQYTTIYTVPRGKIKPSSFWSVVLFDDDCTIINSLMYGIIKHDDGPLIDHVDSIYLDYKTVPKWEIRAPELSMFVLVHYKNKNYDYVITQLDDHQLTLSLIGQDDVKPILTANKIDNRWVIKNRKYKLIRFGGWKNQMISHF